ncbi:high mobility group box domain-containing protein [Glomus cerebriforme]|uniref:High mobility group box domain-containing protein n=1 Tax=Glomus cerebriforme TaxID=658196 RepID=A0A397SY63_9GLOM|nr:high mobility group box domain-containing protein [Glomus cerebriforme]
MNMLGKLSQSTLSTRTLGTIPTLYYNCRIVGINLLRQYTSNPQESESKSTQQDFIFSGIPEEPKRPPSAYALFYANFFNKYYDINPEFRVTDIARLAGEEWSNLPLEEKNIYIDRQKKMATEYEKIHEAWLNSLTSKQIVQENRRRRLTAKLGKKKPKMIKDPRTPNPPKTPYIMYVTKRMKEEEGIDIKLLFDEWENLSSEEKKPFMMEYEEEKLQYENEMEKYKKLIK